MKASIQNCKNICYAEKDYDKIKEENEQIAATANTDANSDNGFGTGTKVNTDNTSDVVKNNPAFGNAPAGESETNETKEPEQTEETVYWVVKSATKLTLVIL